MSRKMEDFVRDPIFVHGCFDRAYDGFDRTSWMRYRSLPVENGVTGAPPLFHLSHSLRRMKGIVYRANINGRTAMLGSLFWPKAEKTCKVPPPYIPEHACFFFKVLVHFFCFSIFYIPEHVFFSSYQSISVLLLLFLLCQAFCYLAVND